MSTIFLLAPTVAILTKHDKQSILSPLFQESFDVSLVHTDKFDTDSLGTFDNKIERKLSTQQAALKKAYLSCELTGCSQGLGSEGSFNSVFPIGTLNEEFIAFVDVEHNVEVLAYASQLSPLGIVTAHSSIELQEKLKRYAPEQRWMVNVGEHYIKGQTVNEMLAYAAKQASWPLQLEPDFRAMYCPERQGVIRLAGEDLINRLSSLCPQCAYLDFVGDKPVSGLLCELCHQPTEQIQHFLARCKKCEYEEKCNEVKTLASAFNCNFCNP
jgi:hypothetical protein